MFNNKGPKKRRGIHFEIIPMIDVMMILVLFLSVMAFLPQVQSAINTPLPGSGSKNEVTPDDIMVTITAGKTVVVGNSDMSLSSSEVIPAIRREMGAQTNRRVVIAADKNLPYEEVVKMLSELQAADFKNVALATEKKQ